MTARPKHQAHRPERSESLIRRLAIHEASHAVTRLCLALDTVTEVTIEAPRQKMPLLYRRCKDWAHHLATTPELAADVNKRLENAYEEALKLVRKQAAAIDYVYGELLRHGTLKGPKLEAVVAEARKLMQP